MTSRTHRSTPLLPDLARLSARIEADRALGWSELHQRDAEIGARCSDTAVVPRLLYWLEQVEADDDADREQPRFSASGVSTVLAALLAALGLSAMVGFLLAHPDGRVNVLWFVAVFVLPQWLMLVASIWGLVSLLLGRGISRQWLQPGFWWFRRSPWAARLLREASDLVQLLFLRQGQLLGMAFIAGATLGFLLTLLANPFSFMWGSTYALGEATMNTLMQVLASPWAGWLPAATVDPQLVAASRYHAGPALAGSPSLPDGSSWWPFLLMVVLVYTLLPRLLLWLLSGRLYRRRLLRTFSHYPGADLVLRRMQHTVPETRGEAQPDNAPQPGPVSAGEAFPEFAGALLVNWNHALADGEAGMYRELQGLADERLLGAGSSLAEDEAALARIREDAPPLVLLLVKAWEPPMADLADFLDQVTSTAPGVLLLRPLPGHDVQRDNLDDWRQFAAQRIGRPVVTPLTAVGEIA